MQKEEEKWTEKQEYLWDSAGIEFKNDYLRAALGIPHIFAEYIDTAEKRHLSKIFRELNLKLSNKKLLDIGCGSGRWSFWFAEKYNLNVTGTDISQKQIEIAEERKNKLKHSNIEFMVSSLEDYEATDKYELISSMGALCYIYDLKKAAKRIKDVSKNNTILIIRDRIAKKEEVISNNTIFRLSKTYIDTFESLGFKLIYNDLARPPCFPLFFSMFLPKKIRESKNVERIFYLGLKIQYLLDPFLIKFNNFWSKIYTDVPHGQFRFFIFKKGDLS